MWIKESIGVFLSLLFPTGSKIRYRKTEILRLIGVLIRLISLTESKIRHRKIGIGWSIWVLLRWLSSTRSKICQRKMRVGWSIGVFLRWLSSTGSKICHWSKIVDYGPREKKLEILKSLEKVKWLRNLAKVLRPKRSEGANREIL